MHRMRFLIKIQMNFIWFCSVDSRIKHPLVQAMFALFQAHKKLCPFISLLNFDCNHLPLNSTRPRGKKTCIMLNSAEQDFFFHADKSQISSNCNSFLLNIAEHENFSANKYENANFCWHFHTYYQSKFHAQLSWAWKKVLLPRALTVN